MASCRVDGCSLCGPGQAHYCKHCKNSDSPHFARDCPTLTHGLLCSAVWPHHPITPITPTRRCRVAGCFLCSIDKPHFCGNCGDNDSTHFKSNCRR